MKTSIICLVFVLLARIAHAAAVVDAPHNETNDMGCKSCHSYSLWWEFSPVLREAALRADKVNSICLTCHGDNGPEMKGGAHSNLGMGSLTRAGREGGEGLGEWSRVCTDCHDPHFQAQLYWQGTVPESELYLVTGDLTPATLSFSGDGTPESPFSSTFDFTSLTVKSNWANATSPWAAKNGTINRGLILVLTTTTPDITFELTEVDETAGTIAVNGKIPDSYNSGVRFGLIYGQLIRKEIVGKAGVRNVKFFDPKGGFVNTFTNDGLCQVCHGDTLHFTYNDANAANDHTDKFDKDGAAGAASRCTYCHRHDRGFAPGSGSGKHAEHLAMGMACTVCHLPGGGAMDPDTATGCNTCHQDGTGGPANDGGDYRSHWLELDPDYALTCASCHDLPPSYANGSLKANSHGAHAGIACNRCHAATTADGTTITSPAKHVNQVADVTPDVESGVDFTYTYAAGGGSCANISCHGNNSATWGSTTPMTCQSCHLGGADVDDFTASNNVTAIIADTGEGSWDSTGHGKPAAMGSYLSGNAAADFTGPGACLFCHDNTITHATAANPFRLRNFADLTWGKNGVCQSCHAADSPGVMVDGTEKNSVLTIGSIHFGTKHGTANTGGQFCWDCHDAHGDGNASMIQAAVAKASDTATGTPTTTVDTVFTVLTTGVDYVKLSAPFNGICQVCHTATTFYNPSANGHYTDTCDTCHVHSDGRGFGGGVSGKHPGHLAMGVGCEVCHDPDGEIGTLNPLTATGCNTCHQDGRGGPPNDGGEYRIHWVDQDPDYALNCNACHKGRLVIGDVVNTANYTHFSIDTECGTCHDGRVTLAEADNEQYAHAPADSTCGACHDGPGSNPLPDVREEPVGMQTNGHSRLASSKWIRQYACYYCHTETVDAAGNLTAKHLNHAVDVKMDAQWAIVSKDPPAYVTDPDTGLKTCMNVYCHTDGTTVEPEMRAYAWAGGHQECNSCHGHNPSSGGCNACHSDGRDGNYWSKFPEKKWLSAMPMYENTGPLTDKANSHYRHLFTGFSCDDCHAETITGSSCLACHSTTIPTGNMTENKHINPAKHVNRVKNVAFKNGGNYNPATKTCSNTACHTGTPPQWGGSAHDAVVCRDCHGQANTDVDDFGAFNGSRAKINLTQWASTGHGRPGVIDPATGIPEPNTNRYPSGNPPANFPDTGCWYCHDSRVLHQNEEDPFRLIQHQHFKKRFEKECVFCHMQGKDSECLSCHSAVDGETLAPQLSGIAADPEAVINPPYTIARPDHRELTGGCDASTCHIDDQVRHKTEAGVWTQDQKDDVQNSYVQMGVCLICHDDDASGECTTCHQGPQFALGFDPADNDPGLAGKTGGRITAQTSKASSSHFGYKHYQDYQNSIGTELESGKVSDTVADSSQLVDSTKSWGDDAFSGRWVVIVSGGKSVLYRPIVHNSANTLTVSPPFPDAQPLQPRDSYTIMEINWLDAGTVSAVSTSSRQVIDTTQTWTPDAYSGRRLLILSGANADLSRTIVRNSADTLTVSPPFPDDQPLQAGDAYKVMDIVWKGGKFCWDCHDPHGDDNIYMIQNDIATRTDGVVGKPMDRKSVSFIRKSTGLDYARIAPNPATGKYDGVCNVCHTNNEMHYTSTKGDNHNSGRVCTECHEHRFTDSHASEQACNTCHENRPVPRHTGFSQARDCTKCHKDAIGARMNIMRQFSANSHHVQSATVTNKHCYACHWEATADGVINPEYHAGYNNKTHTSDKNKEVDLVLWQAGHRPTAFDDDGENGDDTAVSFLAAKIDTTKVGNTLAEQRGEVSKVTSHCLGCHSDQNNDTEPFTLVDQAHGDCKTPRQYAWDRSSVAARYENPGTANLGKYNTANAAKKIVTKAFSAHGNAVANEGGVDPATGEDGTIPNTRDGLYNVQCYDCHSSHGSMVTGTTSSYTTFNGTKNGANLKETQAGKGGYPMTYMATANPDPTTVNPYQAGAGQCFDCHETANTNTQISPASKTPWGYSDTFGETAPVKGDRDTARFSGSFPGASQFASYRAAKRTVGGHFRASHKNPASPNYSTNPAADITAMGTIDGLCTPCHDPHGVSPALGEKQAYALPMLKGTWLSSPYKEDGPPLMTDGYSGTPGFRNDYNQWSSYTPRPYPQKADPKPPGTWRSDRTTFNLADQSVQNNQAAGYGRVSEEAETFAGLCLRCHPKSTLTSEVSVEPTADVDWATPERIHRSVKGWGWNEGDTPREHSYTCSKCHQPHASGLPRLMKTNCLNFTHRGKQVSGGTVLPTSGSHKNENGRFPNGWWNNGRFSNYSTVICHGAPTANGPTKAWPDNQGWNTITPWSGGQ